MNAFVCDLTKQTLPDFIPQHSVDLVTMIFVLSAIDPASMKRVIQNLCPALKDKGKILFRGQKSNFLWIEISILDYAVSDAAQKRFEAESSVLHSKKLGPNLYVRGDGTMSYFFDFGTKQMS